jgi:hypothetical protein
MVVRGLLAGYLRGKAVSKLEGFWLVRMEIEISVSF